MGYVSRVFHSSLEEHPNLQSEGDRLLFGAFGFFWVCSSHFLHNRAFVFFFLHRFLNSNRNFAHINLALSLILAELLFVLGIDKTQNQVRCSIVLFVFVVSFFSFFALQFLLNESSKNQVLVISWHAILCHVMISVWSHFTSCHVINLVSRHVIWSVWCHATLCHVIRSVSWCDAISFISCHVLSRYA